MFQDARCSLVNLLFEPGALSCGRDRLCSGHPLLARRDSTGRLRGPCGANMPLVGLWVRIPSRAPRFSTPKPRFCAAFCISGEMTVAREQRASETLSSARTKGFEESGGNRTSRKPTRHDRVDRCGLLATPLCHHHSSHSLPSRPATPELPSLPSPASQLAQGNDSDASDATQQLAQRLRQGRGGTSRRRAPARAPLYSPRLA